MQSHAHYLLQKAPCQSDEICCVPKLHLHKWCAFRWRQNL